MFKSSARLNHMIGTKHMHTHIHTQPQRQPNMFASSSYSVASSAAASVHMVAANGPESDDGAHDTYATPNKVFFHAQNKDVVPTLTWENLEMSENGLANFRDAAVLGKNPTLVLPEKFRKQKVRLAIHLNHDSVSGRSGSAPMPKFMAKHVSDADKLMKSENPLGANEAWVNTLHLGPNLHVTFKKRAFALSAWYRKVCGTRWPNFVISASFERVDGVKVTEISEEFEVRSKEQGHKTRAARGLSSTATKRRTPAIEALDVELRTLQADIVLRRDAIQKLESENTDYMTRFQFIRRILATRNSSMSEKLRRMCSEQERCMEKWIN